MIVVFVVTITIMFLITGPLLWLYHEKYIKDVWIGGEKYKDLS